MDPYAFLRISRNPDGTLDRSAATFTFPATDGHPTDSSSLPSLSKDIPLDPSRGTSIRIFRPNPPPSSPLPIILYFHGGGFILFSPSTFFFHQSSSRLAAALPALVLSVDYRLAPEHRLPAAYDDAVDALLWLRAQAQNPAAADPWLAAGADFNRCFIAGTSSGGNIAYHLARRAAEMGIEALDPLRIAGAVLNQPYFGGVERTESEIRMKEDKILPMPANDLMWELALPEGADRDHEYCNPAVAADRDHEYCNPAVAAGEGRPRRRMPRFLVRGFLGDPLIDRQKGLVRMLVEEGVSVVAKVEREGHHGIEIFKPEMAELFLADVREFLAGGARL